MCVWPCGPILDRICLMRHNEIWHVPILRNLAKPEGHHGWRVFEEEGLHLFLAFFCFCFLSCISQYGQNQRSKEPGKHKTKRKSPMLDVRNSFYVTISVLVLLHNLFHNFCTHE